MANELDRIPGYLAANIQALRRAQGLSQAALSQRARLPRSTVTNLESGTSNPSLSGLLKVAGALGVPLEELIARPRARCSLVRAQDLAVVDRSRGGVRIHKLLPDPVPGLEMDRLRLAPGSMMKGVPHLPGTREYLACESGSVVVYVAGENFVVCAGDVLVFPGDQNHSYANRTAEPAVCYSVVSLVPVPDRGEEPPPGGGS